MFFHYFIMPGHKSQSRFPFGTLLIFLRRRTILEIFYYKTSDTRYAYSPTRTIELTSDTEFTILSGSDRQTVSFHADGSRITFTFPDGESLAGTWNGDDLMGPKGFPLGWDEINILVNGEPDRLSNPAWGLALGRIYFGKTETISDWFVPFLGILIYIIGIVTIPFPLPPCIFSSTRYNI